MSGTEGKGSEVEWEKARRVMCEIKGKVMQVLFCELEIIRESQNSRTEVEKINSCRGFRNKCLEESGRKCQSGKWNRCYITDTRGDCENLSKCRS